MKPPRPANDSSLPWLVLVHQVPSRPARARVATWRRLQRLGAVGLRNAVYVLPNSAQAREDFEWLRAEIEAAGGGATVFEAAAVDAASGGQIEAAFRDGRRRDYEEIRAQAERLRKSARAAKGPGARRRLDRARRALAEQLREVRAIDFFDAPGGEEAAAELASLDRALEGDVTTRGMNAEATSLRAADYRGRRWVTRPRPGIDRMSSAWLIRRFVDPKARFAFADRPEDAPRAVPFDMYGVELGHQGDDCTFETLVKRFGIEDPAVGWIGRIVHDLDLKEDRYAEPEEAAVARLVAGLRRLHADDARLLESGIEMFEALYRSFEAAPAPTGRRGGRSGQGASRSRKPPARKAPAR